MDARSRAERGAAKDESMELALVERFTVCVTRNENTRQGLKSRRGLVDTLGMMLATLLVLTLRTVAFGALAFVGLMVWRRKQGW